jgi:hypothetical protein
LIGKCRKPINYKTQLKFAAEFPRWLFVPLQLALPKQFRDASSTLAAATSGYISKKLAPAWHCIISCLHFTSFTQILQMEKHLESGYFQDSTGQILSSEHLY